MAEDLGEFEQVGYRWRAKQDGGNWRAWHYGDTVPDAPSMVTIESEPVYRLRGAESGSRDGSYVPSPWHARFVGECEGGDNHEVVHVHVIARCACGAAYMSTDGGIALSMAQRHTPAAAPPCEDWHERDCGIAGGWPHAASAHGREGVGTAAKAGEAKRPTCNGPGPVPDSLGLHSIIDTGEGALITVEHLETIVRAHEAGKRPAWGPDGHDQTWWVHQLAKHVLRTTEDAQSGRETP